MYVIGHRDIGMNPGAMFVGHLSEVVQITAVVLFRKETGFAVIAALNDVLRNIR